MSFGLYGILIETVSLSYGFFSIHSCYLVICPGVVAGTFFCH